MLLVVHGHPDLLFFMILNLNDLKNFIGYRGGKGISKIKWTEYFHQNGSRSHNHITNLFKKKILPNINLN